MINCNNFMYTCIYINYKNTDNNLNLHKYYDEMGEYGEIADKLGTAAIITFPIGGSFLIAGIILYAITPYEQLFEKKNNNLKEKIEKYKINLVGENDKIQMSIGVSF